MSRHDPFVVGLGRRRRLAQGAVLGRGGSRWRRHGHTFSALPRQPITLVGKRPEIGLLPGIAKAWEQRQSPGLLRLSSSQRQAGLPVTAGADSAVPTKPMPLPTESKSGRLVPSREARGPNIPQATIRGISARRATCAAHLVQEEETARSPRTHYGLWLNSAEPTPTSKAPAGEYPRQSPEPQMVATAPPVPLQGPPPRAISPTAVRSKPRFCWW